MPINLMLSILYFIYYNPKLVISVGKHSSVFMCLLAKIFNRKVIHIETFNNVDEFTLSEKIIYNLADEFITQNKALQKKYLKAKYIGEMF